jgi:Family of unknown function (DUF6510)
MTTSNDDYLDGNAAAGVLSELFTADVTRAEGQCDHCGVTRDFVDAHVFMHAPGMVVRCMACEGVLLRTVKLDNRILLDMRGVRYLSVETVT